MANTDNAQGLKFKPVGANVGLVYYDVDASNASPIGKNDPVAMDADGNVSRLAADGTDCVGVVQVIENSNGLSINYLAASTAGKVGVVPCAGNHFVIQSDGATAATDVGSTVDIVASDCDTTTGVSTFQLDHSDIGTGTQLRIIGKAPSQESDNEWGAANVDVVVEFNKYLGSAGSASV